MSPCRVTRRGFCSGPAASASVATPLALNQRLTSLNRHKLTMPDFVFNCPTTSMNVQYWLEDDDDALENEYKGITCPACARLHFLNRKTGKLLGQDGGSSP